MLRLAPRVGGRFCAGASSGGSLLLHTGPVTPAAPAPASTKLRSRLASTPAPLLLRHPVPACTRLYAQPRKKLPSRTVDVHCSNCNAHLYKYAKGNGKKVSASSQLLRVETETRDVR